MTLSALTVAGTAFVPGHVEGRTALSALFWFRVTAASVGEPHPAVTELVGQPFELTLGDRFDRSLSVRGVVMAVEGAPSFVRGAGYVLELGPEVAPLTVGQDCRVFQEQSAVDIIQRVLQRARIQHVRWETQGNYASRPYCAQYRESDWVFIERLLAEEGIYYWFEHGSDATTLVFSDDSTAAPAVEGPRDIPFHDDAALHATRDCVVRVRRTQRIASDKVRLRDSNHEKPRLTLDASAGTGTREVYDFPGRFASPGQGAHRARTRLEAAHARVAVTSGEAWTTRLRSGLVVELTDHPIAALNQRYLLDEVLYAMAEMRGGARSEESELRMQWSAIPAATPFRATVSPVTRSPGGPQTGVVVGAPGEEIHPDQAGRVRVQFYWDREGKRDDNASTWMRVGQFPIGGSMIVPRIGWDMLVDFQEGYVDVPVVVAHLYDGQHPVPYALPANKTRTVWQTATTPGGSSANEMRFEDKKSSEEVFINASKDMNVVVGDNKMEAIGVDSQEAIGANRDVRIGANLKVGITSNQTVDVGANESLTIAGGAMLAVNGAESDTIGASRTVTASKGISIDATGGRTLAVGGTMMAASAMGVNRSVLGSLSVSVGGAWISAAATGVTNLTGGAASETVGGAKIHAGAAGCSVAVKGAAAETIGGAYVIAAGGNAGEAASGTLAITVGGAFVANAPAIEVEAEAEIAILCGGASVTIKGSSVEVKAPTIAAPGATLKKKASAVHHN